MFPQLLALERIRMGIRDSFKNCSLLFYHLPVSSGELV